MRCKIEPNLSLVVLLFFKLLFFYVNTGQGKDNVLTEGYLLSLRLPSIEATGESNAHFTRISKVKNRILFIKWTI